MGEEDRNPMISRIEMIASKLPEEQRGVVFEAALESFSAGHQYGIEELRNLSGQGERIAAMRAEFAKYLASKAPQVKVPQYILAG
jgi:hypothetical protein